MKAKTFHEYLDARSKMQNTGKEQHIADYVGPKNASPGKEKKHKDAGGHGQKGTPAPYAGTTTAKDPNKGKHTDGFAAKGDKKLEYNPHKGNKKTTGKAGVPGGKEVTSWPKTKTQEWVDSTKDMSLGEFTKHLQKISNVNLEECHCQGVVPMEVIQQVATIAKAHDSIMTNLVREMKRQGSFEKLVAEMLQHEETYKAIAQFMESDQSYARRLARAMNEMVAPPMHDEFSGEDEEEPKPKMKPGMGMDDEGEGDMDMDSEMGDEGESEDEGGEGDEDMDMDANMDSEMDGDDMGDMGGGDFGKNSDMAPHMPPRPKKKKKLHAHNHLMNAMKDHPAMAGDMGMGNMGM